MKLWFKRIPYWKAFGIRMDVQLYDGMGSNMYGPCGSAEGFRDSQGNLDNGENVPNSPFWTKWSWWIEVDPPNKEEYNGDG